MRSGRWSPNVSRSDAEAFEAVALDGVRAQELPALVGVHVGAGAQPMGDGARVGPGAVGVRIVGLEQDVLEPDLAATAQAVHVVEHAAPHATADDLARLAIEVDAAGVATLGHDVHALELV